MTNKKQRIIIDGSTKDNIMNESVNSEWDALQKIQEHTIYSYTDTHTHIFIESIVMTDDDDDDENDENTVHTRRRAKQNKTKQIIAAKGEE